MDELKIDDMLALVRAQIVKNENDWGPYHSAHEAYGVTLEEMDELWEHVKTKQKNRNINAMLSECLDVAACAIRFAYDICNEERGRI